MPYIMTYEECTVKVAKQIKSCVADGDTRTIVVEEWKQNNEED
jgi:hypothetical protein